MSSLAEVAQFTPWANGSHEVSPSLRTFGTDFGNGSRDRTWFLIDRRYEEFLASKKAALAEDRSKYVQTEGFSDEVQAAAVQTISRELIQTYPELAAKLCGASLSQIAEHLQEDICVVRADGERDWVAYLHLCSPSHWRATDKIGRPFFDVHAVIPGFDRVNRVSSNLVHAMIHKGPFVRFAWTVESDCRPNHHPDPPPGRDPKEWEGRDFSNGRFWVRVERQVIWGLPDVGASIFTIKLYHMSDHEVLASPPLREALVSALHSMSPQTRAYKGLTRDWSLLMDLLRPGGEKDLSEQP